MVEVFTIIQQNKLVNYDTGQGWGEQEAINICRPNSSKSCAACCGLYNIVDCSPELVSSELRRRTRLLALTPRSVDELVNFKEFIAKTSPLDPIDPDIHVCEFIGFLDSEEKMVGCTLHPSAGGNEGVDYRGLCHYGAMACKSFYCPAWTEMPERIKHIIANVAPDWRTYGLMITDVAYSCSIVRLAETRSGCQMNPGSLKNDSLRQKLTDILLLKDRWPLSKECRMRRNNYYFRNGPQSVSVNDPVDVALSSLAFTYGVEFNDDQSKSLINALIDDLVICMTLSVDNKCNI